MKRIEEVNQGDVLALEKFDMQVAHESAECQPKVVTHQDDALEFFAIALPKGLSKFGVSCSTALAWSHCSN